MLMRTVVAFVGMTVAILASDACGIVASKLGRDKGYSAMGTYFLGFLLSVIGLIVAAVLPYKPQVASGEVEVDRSHDRAVTVVAVVVGVIALLPTAYVLLTPVGQLPRM